MILRLRNLLLFKTGHNSKKIKSESAQTFYIHVALGHQYVSENVIKMGGDFGAIFQEKPWAIVHAFS